MGVREGGAVVLSRVGAMVSPDRDGALVGGRVGTRVGRVLGANEGGGALEGLTDG